MTDCGHTYAIMCACQVDRLREEIESLTGQRDEAVDLLREAYVELATVEAITVSPTCVDNLLDLVHRMRACIERRGEAGLCATSTTQCGVVHPRGQEAGRSKDPVLAMLREAYSELLVCSGGTENLPSLMRELRTYLERESGELASPV